MKRYLVFQWIAYDTAGGWHDKTGDFLTREEAKASLNPAEFNAYQIVDTWTDNVEDGSMGERGKLGPDDVVTTTTTSSTPFRSAVPK